MQPSSKRIKLEPTSDRPLPLLNKDCVNHTIYFSHAHLSVREIMALRLVCKHWASFIGSRRLDFLRKERSDLIDLPYFDRINNVTFKIVRMEVIMRTQSLRMALDRSALSSKGHLTECWGAVCHVKTRCWHMECCKHIYNSIRHGPGVVPARRLFTCPTYPACVNLLMQIMK